MSRWMSIVLILLPLLVAGCRSDQDRNKNRDNGRPKMVEESKPAAPKK